MAAVIRDGFGKVILATGATGLRVIEGGLTKALAGQASKKDFHRQRQPFGENRILPNNKQRLPRIMTLPIKVTNPF